MAGMEQRFRRKSPSESNKIGLVDGVQPKPFGVAFFQELESAHLLHKTRYSIDTSLDSSQAGVAVLKGQKHDVCADYLVLKDCGSRILAAVLDGVGSSRYPADASHFAAQGITKYVGDNAAVADGETLLINSFNDANEILLDEFGSKTTAVAVLIDKEKKKVNIASVGNSRVYHIRGTEVKRLVGDQGVGWLLFEHLGKKDPEIQTRAIDYTPGDILFLCTDGIHEVFPDQQINAILSEREPPQVVVNKILKKTHQIRRVRKSERDDECAILIKLP